MSPNFIQEQLSLAYVRAVIYRAGFNLSRLEVDDHGIDGTIRSYDRRVNQVDFQLKATTDYSIGTNAISYDLRASNYNRLVAEDDLPYVLILFIMPSEDSQWLSQSDDELCLRYCAYWESLAGKPTSGNTSTVRVAVPLVNRFDVPGLPGIFRQLIS